MTTDQAPKDPFQDADYKAAFKRWWDADYSVEGLKKKTVNISGSAGSLHDYWFDGSPLQILKFGGRDWTIFHLPAHDLEGNPSKKASWSEKQIEAFYKLTFDREQQGLRAYREYPTLAEDLKPRAYFDGVVFPDRGSKPGSAQIEVCPSYVNAIFAGAAHLGGFGNVNTADFSGCIFVADAEFASRGFSGITTFEKALFLGSANFSSSSFGGPTMFLGTRFRDAKFNHAAVHVSLLLRCATFSGSAEFLDGSARGVTVHNTIFEQSAIFARRKFHGPLHISNSYFSGDADFRDCSFEDELRAKDVAFHGPVRFSSRTGDEFGGAVRFLNTEFFVEADFSGREFRRATQFVGCTFAQAPLFFGAKPHPSTSFTASRFLATLGQEDVVLDKPLGSLIFRWVPFAEWLPTYRLMRNARDAATKALEDSYRNLRHLFENDSEQAGRFYALEMDTRRRRTDVSIVERWLLFFFWLTSGYGRYIGRALGILLAAVGLITLGMSVALSHIVWPDLPPNISDVFAFVWRLFLLPAPYSGPEAAKVYWVAAFIKKWPVAHVLLSGVCALLTTGTVGVILVTLRRRFALR